MTYMLKVLPLLSNFGLLRAFQWGAVKPYNSRGIKNSTCQSWKFKFIVTQVDLDVSTLTCCIFDTPWGAGVYGISLESSWKWGFEKCNFTTWALPCLFSIVTHCAKYSAREMKNNQGCKW